MRPTFAHYEAGMKFRREAERWNETQKREWILERLRFIVRCAALETDYYRELFDAVNFDSQSDFSFDDFARLPVLEREDVHAAKEKLVSRAVPEKQLQKDATGGSTGTPTEIWLGAEERGWKESGVDFSMERVGILKGAKTAYFWGHHLDPNASDNWRDRAKNYAENIR